MVAERTIPLSRLHAVETQALHQLSLIWDMSRALRMTHIDGAFTLIRRAEAVEANFNTGGSLTPTGLLAAVEQFLEEYEPPISPDPETGENRYDCCGAATSQGHVPSCPFWGLKIAAIRERARLHLKRR